MEDPVLVNVVNTASYTPAETIELVSRAGVKKGQMPPHKVFLSAVSAGCLLSFACAACLTANTAPWFQENAPGWTRLLGALVFPLGLVLVVLTGADLFTGSNMYTGVAALQRRLSVSRMLLHWFLCFWGNMAGSLLVMALIFGYGGVFESNPYRAAVISFVTKKQVVPTFQQVFLRGIGCNWLVCLGCFLAMQAKDLNSKVVAMWWPIFCFVACGMDHVVANMFFIPLGLWLSTPSLTVGMYIWKGVIPAALGNMIGGFVFCGGYYWFMYLFGQPELAVDGLHYHAPSPATVVPVIDDTAERHGFKTLTRFSVFRGSREVDVESGASSNGHADKIKTGA